MFPNIIQSNLMFLKLLPLNKDKEHTVYKQQNSIFHLIYFLQI